MRHNARLSFRYISNQASVGKDVTFKNYSKIQAENHTYVQLWLINLMYQLEIIRVSVETIQFVEPRPSTLTRNIISVFVFLISCYKFFIECWKETNISGRIRNVSLLNPLKKIHIEKCKTSPTKPTWPINPFSLVL